MERPIGWRRVTDGATPPPGIAASLQERWVEYAAHAESGVEGFEPPDAFAHRELYYPIFSGTESPEPPPPATAEDLVEPTDPLESIANVLEFLAGYVGESEESMPMRSIRIAQRCVEEFGREYWNENPVPSETAAVAALRDLVAAIRSTQGCISSKASDVIAGPLHDAEAVLEGLPAPPEDSAPSEPAAPSDWQQYQMWQRAWDKQLARAEAAEAECAGLREQLEAKGDATHSRRPDGFYYCHGYYRDGYFKPGDCNCPICLSQRLEEQVEVNRAQAAANLEAIRAAGDEPLRAREPAETAKPGVWALFREYEAATREANGAQSRFEDAAVRSAKAREALLAALEPTE